MGFLFLVIAALLPAVVLCVYVFSKDRVEKEPFSFLVKLFFFGVLSCFPTIIVSGEVTDIIDSLFLNKTLLIETSYGVARTTDFYIHNFLYYFIGVALVEEGMKFIALLYVTRKSKEYNSYFDGLIYSVFVSLGFAAFENVLYVLSNGFTTAVLRAVLSVPGHMFFAVLMGYHYSLWHITEKAQTIERIFMEEGIIPYQNTAFPCTRDMVKSLLMPILAHGLYDFCCAIGTTWALLALLAFVIFMYIHCFGKIRKMSKADAPERDYVKYMILNKYPHLISQFE